MINIEQTRNILAKIASQNKEATSGTGIGALVGASAGSVVGYLAGDEREAALKRIAKAVAGVIIGGGIGAGAGYVKDKYDTSLNDARKRYHDAAATHNKLIKDTLMLDVVKNYRNKGLDPAKGRYHMEGPMKHIYDVAEMPENPWQK